MDDVRAGRRLRALRHRLSWTQERLGGLARVSQDAISRVERGHLDRMPLYKVRAIARSLDADLLLVVRWRGGDLDRLIDEGHAALLGRIIAILQANGWDTRSEVSYSIYGERGSIDLLAWHAATRTLLVVEVKTELTSVEETLRKHDEKTRLAARIASERFGWDAAATAALLVLPDVSTARRRVERHKGILESAYPLRAEALRRWLRRPWHAEDAARTVSGLLFLSPTHGVRGRCGPVSRKRIRTRSRPAN